MPTDLSVTIAVQRVGFLTVVPRLLREFDVEPAGLLAQAGLGPHALEDPEATIPYAAMSRMAELAAEATQCPHFGLLIGKQIDAASLGLVGRLMKDAPTLGAALIDLATNQHRRARGSTVYLFKTEGRALFGYTVYQTGLDAIAQTYDGAAAATFNIVRELLNSGDLAGLQVSISRAQPADKAPYRAFFGAPVQFDAGHTGVSFPASWLDRPVSGADPQRRASLQTQVAAYQLAGPNDVVTQAKRAISIGLLTGEASGKAVAAGLGYSERTLHRRLAEHATGFQDLLDDARFGLAKHFLSGTKLAVREVALIVGFAEASVFTRAFSLWAGMLPSEWRSRRMGVPDKQRTPMQPQTITR